MLHYERQGSIRLAEMVPLYDPTAARIMTADERRRTHTGVDAPLKPSRVGNWRQETAPEEQAAFEQIAGDTLQELGYPTVREAPRT